MTPDQLQAAVDVGKAFWAALAEDDDETVRRLLTADALTLLALGPITPGTPYPTPRQRSMAALASPGPDIAARVRAKLQIERADCDRIGTYSQAERLSDGELRIAYLIADAPKRVAAGEPFAGWRFEFELDVGAWLVDPFRRHNREALEYVDLGIAPRWD